VTISYPPIDPYAKLQEGIGNFRWASILYYALFLASAIVFSHMSETIPKVGAEALNKMFTTKWWGYKGKFVASGGIPAP
jgi:hypothetical protein